MQPIVLTGFIFTNKSYMIVLLVARKLRVIVIETIKVENW